MKHDTKQRIEEYNRRLPKLREKLMAMIVLLVIGAIMATTVSFAWVTLSVNPEVSGVNTSIASNGNLEIALATGPQQPGATQIGDGDLPSLDRNITWGNLINLSDPAYGLSNLVLRPAYLNPDDLLGSPLQGAKYTADGRKDGYMSRFAYATWQSTNPNDPNAPWSFQVDEENLGVRAISSTIMAESSGRPYEIANRIDKANNALATAKEAYIAITKNKEYMEALAHIMGKYMTANMNQSQDPEYKNPTVDPKQAETFAEMFEAFIEVLRLERIAMMELANAQLYIANDNDLGKYTDLAKLEEDYAANQLPTTVKLSGLKQNLDDAAKLVENHQKLVALCEACEEGEVIKWKETDDTALAKSQMKNIVDSLVNVGNCTADGTPVSSIGAQAAYGLNEKSVVVIITNGIIWNFETRTAAEMNVGKEYNGGKGLLVTASGQRTVPIVGTMAMDGKIYANISTNKTSPSVWSQDVAYANEKAKEEGAVSLQADDTYGLAIDFWVRTNAASSFLTLQGNILTESEEVAVLGKDGDDNDVELYYDVVTGTDSNGEEIKVEVDIYKKGETWYLEGTNDEYTPESEPVKRVEIIETVIGYEGENRIWADGNMYLSTDTTTQGSGSCYVFYSETPEDESRTLALLNTMKIAFVDAEGTLLAEAYMDTMHYFVDNGKAIVPIVLNPTSSIEIPNVDGSTTYAITALEQNVATRITAIVYLDGNSLHNEDVLAASEIQGKMNVQFGSTAELSPIVDEKLSSQSMKISASIDKTSFDYDNATEDMISNITVDIEGTNPSRVTAFFVRKISATQGTPMNSEAEKIIFTNAGDGKWTSSYKFTMPGKYVLRSIEVDGVEYDLKEPQTVTVAGFALSDLRWASTNGLGTISDKEFTVMTSAGSASANLNLKFLTENPLKMPKDVEARFVHDENGNSITVDFVMNTNTQVWSGNVSFLTSGEYTLKYLVLDGEYMGVEEKDQLTADITLGLKAAAYSTSPRNFLYGAGVDGDFGNGMKDNEENLYMQVEILDNNGDPIIELKNVKLYYGIAGSTSTENGLDADLTWNGDSGYYEGCFKSRVGIYSFASVAVGENTISTVIEAPTFTIISPNPPEFLGGNTAAVQYKPNPTGTTSDSAYITVEFKDASTAKDTIAAIVQKVDVNGTLVDETTVMNTDSDKTKVFYTVMQSDDAGDRGAYSFLIPITSNAQDGIWILKEIRIWSVFADGKLYDTFDNAIVFDMTGEDKVETTVISKIKATVSIDTSSISEVTKDDNGNITFNGNFMDSYTLPAGAIKVQATDVKALTNGLSELSDIKVTYRYAQSTSVQHGGYTVEKDLSNESTITIGFTSVDGVNFTSTDAVTLTYAGEYTFAGVSGKIKVGDSSQDIVPDDSAPKITIKSTTPTAKITGANYKSGEGGAIAFTDTATTVTHRTYQETTCFLGQNITYDKYEPAKVEITLGEYGLASEAKLEFTTQNTDGVVRLYAEGQQDNGQSTNVYTWTANGGATCERYVGSWESKTGDDEKTPAGTLTATKLILTYNSINFTVDISDITISNPS